MPTLTFIRHAETIYNHFGIFCGRIDCDVTSKGLKQARGILNDYKKDFNCIYISPLKRTKQTLDVILPGSKPIIDERIIEVSLGEWEGKKKSAFSKELVAKYRAGKYFPIGAETNNEVDTRVCSFVEDLFCNYQNNEQILIVTHNGVLKSIKRNFVPDCESIMSNNLEIVTLTDTEFRHYLQIKNRI